MLHLFSRFTILITLILSAQVSAESYPPPDLAVKAYVLKDASGGRILAEQNSQGRVEPASLTKLMTAYLAFKALKLGHLQLNQTLPISIKAWKVEGSKMFVSPDMTNVTVDELLHGMIIQSGNDASIALAEGIASTEEAFAKQMNQEAAHLGMVNTHFMNATGLPDPEHYTTASDLSLLAIALIRDFPEQYQRLYSMKEYTYNKITQPNRNRLLWLDTSVDGMKTGHTESAGYCLISSAKRGDGRLVSVVLGAASDAARAAESQKLLNYGFQFFDAHLLYRAGQTIGQQKIYKGQDNSVEATVAHDIVITLPKGDYAKIKARIINAKNVLAPIQVGHVLGKVQFILDGKVIDERQLVAKKAVPLAGIFGRAIDSIKLIFH